jgi:hypothetical protein
MGLGEERVSDPAPEPDARPGVAGGAGAGRPRLAWRGRLTSALMGVAGGMAVSDLGATRRRR